MCGKKSGRRSGSKNCGKNVDNKDCVMNDVKLWDTDGNNKVFFLTNPLKEEVENLMLWSSNYDNFKKHGHPLRNRCRKNDNRIVDHDTTFNDDFIKLTDKLKAQDPDYCYDRCEAYMDEDENIPVFYIKKHLYSQLQQNSVKEGSQQDSVKERSQPKRVKHQPNYMKEFSQQNCVKESSQSKRVKERSQQNSAESPFWILIVAIFYRRVGGCHNNIIEESLKSRTPVVAASE